MRRKPFGVPCLLWGLEALPLIVGEAHVKNQAHWQSDVLVDWVIETAYGYWANTCGTPFTVEVLPGGMSVGWRKEF